MDSDSDTAAILGNPIPPDEELADLIETAYVQAQIDGETKMIALVRLEMKHILKK